MIQLSRGRMEIKVLSLNPLFIKAYARIFLERHFPVSAYELLITVQEAKTMLLDRILFNNQTPSVLKKALDFQSQRHLLVSSNISNMDTPGYKAKDVNFEGQLRQAIGTSGELKMKTTNGKHIGPGNSAVKNMSPDVFEEQDAAKSNGNNVNLDKEMMKLAENQIAYNATTQLMGKRASTIRAAITEIAQ